MVLGQGRRGMVIETLTHPGMGICSFPMKTEQAPGSRLLKVAIPMAGSEYSLHFGGATQFWIGEGTADSEKLPGQLYPAPKHEPGALPRWLAAQNVDAVVVSQIGERALIMLADAGIGAFFAAGETSPESLVRACLQGQLPRINRENSCCGGHHDHHEGHGCSRH